MRMPNELWLEDSVFENGRECDIRHIVALGKAKRGRWFDRE